MKLLVTGGAGFIGSAVIRKAMGRGGIEIVNLDKLTYAANLDSLKPYESDARYRFEQADICDRAALDRIFAAHAPDAVMHLAAESHVDRSIDGPAAFVETNVVGTFVLLQQALGYWRALPKFKAEGFRFHHVSTDEVFGSLPETGRFMETTPYNPNSPYAASKASSDHLVRAWNHTYGLPTLISNCSNNYGPYHFPEKLIPLTIVNALEGVNLPVYGSGSNVRDWLYVEDHVRALMAVALGGQVGQTYCIGGNSERTNHQVVRAICALMDELAPNPNIGKHETLVSFEADRPGHDLRYAIDPTRISTQLGWQPLETFESGLRKTVEWYLANRPWWERIRSGVYRGERLGVVA